MIKKIRQDLRKVSEPDRIPALQNFFKTGPGQYGEGDIFIGVRVPNTRKVATKWKDAPLEVVDKLLDSEIHEERLLACLILVQKYQKSENKEEIYNFYWKNAKRVNNWDLVDLTAHKIVGDYMLETGDTSKLYELVQSENLWERRISVISTFAFIMGGKFDDSLKLAELLLKDEHDLIHKAVGWMLREVGKRNLKVEEKFLDKHYRNMPRTMLRYAIERFSDERKKHYMKK